MKVILILMWVGNGSSNSPAVNSIAFENKAACERAAETFTKTKTYSMTGGQGWEGYRAAYCVEDRQ